MLGQLIRGSGLKKTKIKPFLDDIAKGISDYDWRASSTPGLTEAERKNQMVFKGSSGYKELRLQLLAHLSRKKSDAAKAARAVENILG